ncbi:MAG: carboxymuconolactone decarboxylase family protein [Zoogloeaceae bacterium]|nr:carboxymuconolactone decarboxylase family protein [Zoogloeaceae bacterium]
MKKSGLENIAPALDKYTAGPLADLWKRPDLPLRDRCLVTLAALIAKDQRIGLPSYLVMALENGVTPGEISGMITHLAFYVGWTNALSAIVVTRDVFLRRGVSPDQIPAASPPLLHLDEAAENKRAKSLHQQFGQIAPAMTHYTASVIFRDLWRRPDLSPRDRGLITISALIANGQTAQLPFYLEKARRDGLSDTEAAESVTHLAFYVGWPNALAALSILKQTLKTP